MNEYSATAPDFETFCALSLHYVGQIAFNRSPNNHTKMCVARLHPLSTSTQALLAAGRLGEQSGRLENATEFYIAAVRLEPTLIEPWLRLVGKKQTHTRNWCTYSLLWIMNRFSDRFWKTQPRWSTCSALEVDVEI